MSPLTSPSLPSASPLAATAARLSAADTHLVVRVGVPDGDGWLPLTAMGAPDRLDRLHRSLVAGCGDRRYAAMDVGGVVVRAAVAAWVMPVLGEARLPTATAGDVWFHLHPDGDWVDAVALATPGLAVLSDDPDAAHPDTTVVADRGALIEALADRLAGLDGLFGVIASALPVGRPALWGALADVIGARALWLAREADLDRPAAWSGAEVLLDALAQRCPALRVRPIPIQVAWSGGTEWFTRRGTCCLWYRTQDAPDPDGDGYCGTCPLRSDASRAARLRDHLESTA